jgi:hypothetical protein
MIAQTRAWMVKNWRLIKIIAVVVSIFAGVSTILSNVPDAWTKWGEMFRSKGETPRYPKSTQELKEDSLASRNWPNFVNRLPLEAPKVGVPPFSMENLSAAVAADEIVARWPVVPEYYYAWAIDFRVVGDNPDESPKIFTVWILCSEQKFSKRVEELCAAPPEYRRDHHLRREW